MSNGNQGGASVGPDIPNIGVGITLPPVPVVNPGNAITSTAMTSDDFVPVPQLQQVILASTERSPGAGIYDKLGQHDAKIHVLEEELRYIRNRLV